MKNKKTIIFAAPRHNGIADLIYNELELLDFEVKDCLLPNTRFKYKSLGQRLFNLYRKVIHNDYEHKNKLKAEANEHYLHSLLDSYEKTDYALIIRPDLYTEEILVKIREKAGLMVAYQWDGLDRFPGVREKMSFFDKFYVFDPEDLKTENVLLTTNFFLESQMKKSNPSEKAFYIGSYEKARWEPTLEILDVLEKIGVKKEILLAPENKDTKAAEENHKGVCILNHNISYSEVLEKVSKSSVILDIHTPVHKGLSLRIFEGIGFQKKVITTNEEVENYDFYHPDNILVWKNQSTQKVWDFLDKPYKKISEDIRKKYSFESWIKNIFDIRHTKTQEKIRIRMTEEEVF